MHLRIGLLKFCLTMLHFQKFSRLFAKRRKQVLFSMAVENEELVQVLSQTLKPRNSMNKMSRRARRRHVEKCKYGKD